METQICTDEILGGSDFQNKDQFWYKVLENISRNKGKYSINFKMFVLVYHNQNKTPDWKPATY